MRQGQGFLAIWSDVTPDQETDYLHWLTREHTQERVSTDGFLGVRVFRSRTPGVRRYFILYSLADRTVLASAAYLARLNAPTAWSRRIMPILGGFRRGGGVVADRFGEGSGAVVAPICVESRALAGDWHKAADIRGADRIVAVTRLEVDGAGTGIETDEKALRSGDSSFEAMIFVEATDASAITGAWGGSPELFDQVYALDRTGLGR